MQRVPLPWRAAYFDGQTAARYEAAFRLTSEALEFDIGDGVLRRWTFREIDRQLSESGSTLHFYKKPYTGEALVVDDPAAVRSLLAGPSTTAVAWHHLAIVAAIGILSVVLLIAAIPHMVGLVVALIPDNAETQLGSAVLTAVAPDDQRARGAAIDSATQLLRDRVLSRVSSREDFELVWIRDERPNALAAPGGKMVVFCGLVKTLENGDQLAAVLAHEAGHVEGRHALRNLVRVLGVRLLLLLAGGGTDILVDSAAMLGALHYMRADEQAADEFGLRLLLESDVPPYAMAAAFRRLQQVAPSSGQLTYLSTHPDLGERIAIAEAFARSHPGSARPVLSASEWQQVTGACRQ